MDDATASGRFIVRDAWTITGRGTCVGGYVESGVFHTGDDVQWFDGANDRRSQCRGVEMVNQKPIQDPPTIGLMIAAAATTDFAEGTVILGFPGVSRRAERG